MARIVEESYIEDLCRWMKSCDERCEITMSRVLAEVKEDLENMPQVVRCKDCKYWEQGKDYEPYCNHWGNMMSDTNADDFCSYGERKKR